MGCPWLLSLFGNMELRCILLWHWRHVDGTPNGLQAHLAHWECPGWARGRRACTWLQPGVCTNGTSFKGDQVIQAPSRTAEVPKNQKAESAPLRDAKSTESTRSTKRRNEKSTRSTRSTKRENGKSTKSTKSTKNRNTKSTESTKSTEPAQLAYGYKAGYMSLSFSLSTPRLVETHPAWVGGCRACMQAVDISL